jgi:hypothetical protein
MKKFFLVVLLFIFCFGCNSQIEQKPEQSVEFIELRIRRWTALEGGETLVLRKINKDWSAMLLGDGARFSCLYQKQVEPKSGWENLWQSLQKEGLMEIPEGAFGSLVMTDGNGFDVELTYQTKLKRSSFFAPQNSDAEEEKRILIIGNLISREFETPMFESEYKRSEVGDYLIAGCENIKKAR